MIRTMRHWLLVFMVLLLPLRGLAGVAMAGQMAAHAALTATHAGMPAAPAHADPAAHDCDGHGQAQAATHGDTGDAGGAPSTADCPTCAHCQACSAVAMQVAQRMSLADRFSQPPPVTVHRWHASAERAPALKPPIS